jgi:DNA polymerase III subunit delta
MPQAISLAQLTTQLAQGVVAPIYLLLGEEDLLRDTALSQLKQSLLGDGGDDFNCDLFYGDEAEGTEIASCASEVAVFAPRRLVIVKATDKLPAKQCDALLAYIKEPNESTTLIFVASKLDGRLKFTQGLLRGAVVVDCAPPKDAQLGPWLKQEAHRAGVRIEEDAIHLLKEACGGSLYSVRREIEKIASYVSADRTVTAEDVAVLRGTEPGASVFDLAAAIGSKNRGKALAILARNLEAGEAPLRILGSLAWQYRRLWKVKELMRQGGREGEAARTLRMDPYRVRPFLGQFPEASLQGALKAFLEADGKLKGGSGGRPAMVLDRLILQLCDRPQASGAKPEKAAPTIARPARTKTLSNVRTISATRPKN